MCGIAGVTAGSKCISADLLRRLGCALDHRGPDDSGLLLYLGENLWTGRTWAGQAAPAELALIHRRLSIIDLGETGWQPMATPDQRYHIVYNGEIYNYVELRAELERAGYRFRSHSDTEVLLVAYAHWGAGAFAHLVGMFALAILDVSRRVVVLARDFFGIKPLYYTWWQDGFAFASEIPCLLGLPGVRPRVDPHRLHAYLRHGLIDHGAASLIQDIRQLPAAHYLELSLDNAQQAQSRPFWRLETHRNSDLSFEEAARHLRELFLDSVGLHLRSDVPVGVALSGGIDSSSIVMAIRRLRGPSHDIHAFSYVASDKRLSEESWSDLVGAAAGAVVHKVRPNGHDLARDLGRVTAAQGEPFGSTSIYAQYRVFEAAGRAGMKVMLDGQGADELLAGYRPYLAARLASLLRQHRWNEAWRFLGRASIWPGTSRTWLVQITGGLLLPGALQVPARRWVGRDLLPAWLNRGWFAERGVYPIAPPGPHGSEVLREQLALAITERSLPALLRYEDRNSMAFSLESRVPFLTPALASFVLSLPEDYLVAPDGTSKAVFRQAMRGIVPDQVLNRKDKIGFETSERTWLAELQPWLEQILTSDAARRIPALNLNALQREWQARLAGRRAMTSTDSPVWRCLNLIQWADQIQAQFD